MTIRTTITLFTMIFFLHPNVALSTEVDLKKYVRNNGFVESTGQEFEWGDNQKKYYVFVDKGELVVQTNLVATTTNSLVENGYQYKAINKGEWGGRLEFISKAKVINMLDGPVVDLKPKGSGLYVLEGLDHLGMRYGSVYFISDRSSPKQVERVTLLPDAPLSSYLDTDDERLLILGARSVMSLSFDSELKILYWYAVWPHGIRPTSIARYGRYILIGLPGGIGIMGDSGSKNLVLYKNRRDKK